ncbi:MAG: hypothetical protein RIC03_14845 [Cyclobacteriaceae bacterium]
MKLRFLTAIICLSFSTITLAQVANISNGIGGAPYRESSKEAEISGEKFLFDKYLMGTVTGSAGEKKDIMFQLDLLGNNIVAYNNGNPLVLYKAAYSDLTFRNVGEDGKEEVYKFASGFDFEGKPDFFYRVLYAKDSFTLLKKIIVKVKSYNKTEYGGGTTTISKFDREEGYFLLYPDGSHKRLESSRSKIIDNFGSHEKDLKSFIKKNRLKFKDESDYIELTSYFVNLEV